MHTPTYSNGVTMYATVNVNPGSAYANLNGQRFRVAQHLPGPIFALAVYENGNTADFTSAEVLAFSQDPEATPQALALDTARKAAFTANAAELASPEFVSAAGALLVLKAAGINTDVYLSEAAVARPNAAPGARPEAGTYIGGISCNVAYGCEDYSRITSYTAYSPSAKKTDCATKLEALAFLVRWAEKRYTAPKAATPAPQTPEQLGTEIKSAVQRIADGAQYAFLPDKTVSFYKAVKNSPAALGMSGLPEVVLRPGKAEFDAAALRRGFGVFPEANAPDVPAPAHFPGLPAHLLPAMPEAVQLVTNQRRIAEAEDGVNAAQTKLNELRRRVATGKVAGGRERAERMAMELANMRTALGQLKAQSTLYDAQYLGALAKVGPPFPSDWNDTIQRLRAAGILNESGEWLDMGRRAAYFEVLNSHPFTPTAHA